MGSQYGLKKIMEGELTVDPPGSFFSPLAATVVFLIDPQVLEKGNA
jgi:hypothetical protein